MPKWFAKDWKKRIGDCIYDYSKGKEPAIRKGVHNEKNSEKDLSGRHALISNHFYYFGEDARIIPKELSGIIKRSQGHLKIENPKLVDEFLDWIKKFKKNKIYADPQLKFIFELTPDDKQIIECSTKHLKDDKNESEEVCD